MHFTVYSFSIRIVFLVWIQHMGYSVIKYTNLHKDLTIIYISRCLVQIILRISGR